MKRSKIIRIGLVAVLAAIILGVATAYYLFNMPHRDVQSAQTDYQVAASVLVAEYLENADAANEKYLASDGDSKILEVSGTVHKITEDFSGNKVVILKEANDKAGVSCTFESNVSSLALGDVVTVKGVINAGASYDADMELYRDVVLNNCTLMN